MIRAESSFLILQEIVDKRIHHWAFKRVRKKTEVCVTLKRFKIEKIYILHASLPVG
jgi:hypothetical protein